MNTLDYPRGRGVLVFGLRVSATGVNLRLSTPLPPGFAFTPVIIGHLCAGEHRASLSGVAWMKLQDGSNGDHCHFVLSARWRVRRLADLIAEPREHGLAPKSAASALTTACPTITEWCVSAHERSHLSMPTA